MSAFRAYSGRYEFGRGVYDWRCYATTRIHDVRRVEHGPLPNAPDACKWTEPSYQDERQRVYCLIDEAVDDFSQILIQVSAGPAPPAASHMVSPTP